MTGYSDLIANRSRDSRRPIVRPSPNRFTPLLLEVLEDRSPLTLTAQVVADIKPGSGNGVDGAIVSLGDKVFFAGDDNQHGSELWVSDGTAAGTKLVKDIMPGNGSSSPNSLFNMNGTLFFVANDGTHGNELWKSDGTAAGTVMVKDIRPGSSGSDPSTFRSINNLLWFVADDGTTGKELWTSDGTSQGTALVANIDNGPGYPNNTTNLNGFILFRANDGTNGDELWKTDGTAGGTKLLKDINVGQKSSYPSYFVVVGNTLFFNATDGVKGGELWKTDGTAGGTVLVRDIHSGSAGSGIRQKINIAGKILFAANDGVNGYELWKSDGTNAGTVLVKDINAGPASSFDPSTRPFTEANGIAFFGATDGTSGVELWKTDGTAAGTVMVTDVRPGPNGSYPQNLTNINGLLYFSAYDDAHGYEIWRSDGTATGTVLVADIMEGAGSSLPAEFATAGPYIVFTADDGVHGRELMRLIDVNAAPTLAAITAPGMILEDAAQFSVNLTGISAGPLEKQALTITAKSSNASLIPDPTVTYTSPSATGSLTFKPVANAFGTATITVTVTDDGGTQNGGVDSFTRTFSVTVTPINDSPTLDALNDLVMDEDAPAQNVSLTGISAGANESQSLTVAASSSNPAIVADPTVIYSSADAGGLLKLTATPNAFGSVIITVTVKDDGGTANGGVDSISRSFAINIIPINDPPSLDPIPDIFSIGLDTGLPILDLTGITAGPFETQNVTILARSTDPTFLADPIVNYASPAPTGLLVFQPPEKTGQGTIILTLKDDGGTATGGIDTLTRTITVNVVPTNHAPSFVKGSDEAATDRDGARTISSWATAISAGPPSESDQALAFQLVASNPSLFSVQPMLDPVTGDLTYMPAPNAHGTAVVTVSLSDSGGTAYGGQDTSTVETFRIVVTKPLAWHNTLQALDVTNSAASGVDGVVAAGDALAIINYINAHAGQSAIPSDALAGPPYLDTWNSAAGNYSGDNLIAPADALAVINWINGHGSSSTGPPGEGEVSEPPPPTGESTISVRPAIRLVSGEGEATSTPWVPLMVQAMIVAPPDASLSPSTACYPVIDLLALLSTDIAEHQARRRWRSA